ncbi:hypothetical protein M758_12G182500 [Ceratodon purpureus]|nr:hypothetical protein M758_12G182500 [Ceratodon purpureus]
MLNRAYLCAYLASFFVRLSRTGTPLEVLDVRIVELVQQSVLPRNESRLRISELGI